MEQRPLRLGHLVDDYCPRERRITNHVIVAIVDDAIRQTRCQTCEAEHPYKAAQAPRRRKKEGTTALYDEVLASVGGSQLVAPRSDGAEVPDAAGEANAPQTHVPVIEPDQPPVAAVAAEANGDDVDDRTEDIWPANRPLIRATLPRTENDQPVPRPIPEFTMHQRHSRGGQGFRHGWQGQGGNGNGGGRGAGGGFRSGRPGSGNGNANGQGQGFGRGPGRPGQGQGDGNRGRHHGKRRPR